MEVEHQTHNNNVQVLKITGRLAGSEVKKIQQGLPIHLKSSNKLIIDCSELEYMDSSGLGALISGLKLAISQKGDLRLACILTKVRMLLEITRADRIFKIYPTVDEALASFETNNVQNEGV
jgi:anti-sigma B factor antagonist